MLLQKFIRALTGLGMHSRATARALALLLSVSAVETALAAPTQDPLMLAKAATPIMMMTMDKDHQLYFKAYDDYSDLTDLTEFKPNGTRNDNYLGTVGDGKPETTYVHKYDYYGYFDSRFCYSYNVAKDKSYFEPVAKVDAQRYCSGQWSGNFLNWATMTRLDIVRKILYGGLRYIDEDTETVLERAFLPNDAHSFAKYYDGTDIAKLTPFNITGGTGSQASGITLCNTTSTINKDKTAGFSQNIKAPPLILVVKGNYSLWASSERFQCRWGTGSKDANSTEESTGYNGNNFARSKINADLHAPRDDGDKKLSVKDLASAGEYNVRVKVCTDSAVLAANTTEEKEEEKEKSNCKRYPLASFANKPVGLLQTYGESKALNFGLITGSYAKNKSGGVLRKNARDMLDEINADTYGTFKAAPALPSNMSSIKSTDGRIINSLNKLRIYGYRYWIGDYYADPGDPSDWCDYHKSSFNDGNCTNWGNPQSEIYFEALRYLSGVKTPSPKFVSSATDNAYIPGLINVPWDAPVTSTNYCAPLGILQFSGSVSSYDTNIAAYDTASAIGLNDTSIKSVTTAVGVAEGLKDKYRFFGKSDSSGDQLCTAKKMGDLAAISGICPESPRSDGGYLMAGLASYARSSGIPLAGISPARKSTVRTLGVALAPANPKVEIIVPGTTGANQKKVIIQPACRNTSTATATNCAIVDFKIVSQETGVHISTGSNDPFPAVYGSEGHLYVNWEDSEQGGDYDQDMWGIISYFVTAQKIYVTTQVLSKSSTQKLGFGYILSGTATKADGSNDDGFHVQSGINFFEYGSQCKGTSTAASTLSTVCTCIADVNTLTQTCDPALAPARTSVFNVATSTSSNAPSFMQSPLYYAAKWGGYSKEFVTKNAANLSDAIATRTPDDSYFFATSPQALAKSLNTAFKTFADDTVTASGVTANDNYLSAGTYIFRSQFDSRNWSGVVQAYELDSKGALAKDPSTGEPKLITTEATDKVPEPDKRKIYVYTGDAKSFPAATANFTWDSLTADQRKLLQLKTEATDSNAQKRVEWIQGKADNETKAENDTLFRSRTLDGVRNILGDFINSSPVYVGANDYQHDNDPEGGKSYRDYVLQKAKKAPRIYIGGNDGMVHAFGAGKDNLLQEIYAYIPTSAFAKLASLTAKDYGKETNPHQYLVDGPIVTGDVYFDGSWRTIVVGTMGAGGKGVYALEVMNDGKSGDGNGVTDTRPRVLFELTDATVVSTDKPAALGYVMNKPVIAPMANGRWAVVFGNGDSANSTSQLYVIDIASPLTHSRVINTGSGTGLSGPALLANGRGQATSAYAGDLMGNIYRFDLSSTSANNWKNEYTLFKAVDKNGAPQPITAVPTLGVNTKRNNATMVYVGTGKYYESGDNVAAASPQHSLYGLVDVGSTKSPLSRTSLYEKTYTIDGSKRITKQDDNPDWNSKDGWYLDFKDVKGERITTKSLLIEDKLIFSTLTPPADICDSGGNSWIMEVSATGNLNQGTTALESNTFRKGLILGDLIIAKSEEGARLLGSTTEEELINDRVNLSPANTGRQSWRQLR